MFLLRIIIFLTMLLPVVGWSASFAHLKTEQIAKESDAFVEATVKAVYTGWSDKLQEPATWVTFGELNMISGMADVEEITLRFCGGLYEGAMVECSGTPDFDEGEHVFMYLQYSGDGELVLTSPNEGLFFYKEKSRSIETMEGYVPYAVQPESVSFSQITPAERDTAIVEDDDMVVEVLDENENVVFTQNPAKLRSHFSGRSIPWNKQAFAKQMSVFQTRNNVVHGEKNFKTNKVVRRYPRLKHLKNHKDLVRELTSGTRKARHEKMRRYFHMLGLSDREMQVSFDRQALSVDQSAKIKMAKKAYRSSSSSEEASEDLLRLFAALKNKRDLWQHNHTKTSR